MPLVDGVDFASLDRPVLPVMSGYGREGEDFILEGGDVRSMVNSGRGGGPASSPAATDPRMAALTAQQQRARG